MRISKGDKSIVLAKMRTGLAYQPGQPVHIIAPAQGVEAHPPEPGISRIAQQLRPGQGSASS